MAYGKTLDPACPACGARDWFGEVDRPRRYFCLDCLAELVTGHGGPALRATGRIFTLDEAMALDPQAMTNWAGRDYAQLEACYGDSADREGALEMIADDLAARGFRVKRIGSKRKAR
jgi:hypothetical protein